MLQHPVDPPPGLCPVFEHRSKLRHRSRRAKLTADEPEPAASETDEDEPSGERRRRHRDERDRRRLRRGVRRLSPEDELDLKRLDIALVTLDDESLRRGLAGITEKQRQELSRRSSTSPARRCTSATRSRRSCAASCAALLVDRQLTVATALTQRANDTTVEALGDHSEDPTRADLDEVLPAVIDEHGVELVRLMVASLRDLRRAVPRGDARAARHRRAVRAPRRSPTTRWPADTELPSFGLVARVAAARADDDPERAELREQRKAAKAERRAAAARERAARAAAQASRREALHASKRTGSGRRSRNTPARTGVSARRHASA